MGDGPGIGSILFGGTSKGGITGCSQPSPKKEEVRYNPFSSEINCNPDALAGKTYEEIANYVMVKLELVRQYSLDIKQQTAVKEAIVKILKEANGNKELPFKDEVDSEPFYYKMYIMTQCRSLGWTSGKAPEIVLPVEQITAATAKIAQTRVLPTPPAVPVQRPVVVQVPAPAPAQAKPEVTMEIMLLATTPSNVIITKNPQAPVIERVIVVGGSFADTSRPSIKIDDLRGNVTVIDFSVAGGSLLVRVQVNPAASVGTYTMSIDNNVADPANPLKVTSYGGEVTFDVADPAPAVAPPTPAVTKRVVRKPQPAAQKTPKLPPCGNFLPALQPKMRATGKCQ